MQSDPIEPANDIPVFVELDRHQCEQLLRAQKVGRLGFTLHDRVQILPIHFVYDEGWIYGRTAAGDKMRTLERNRSVAFEVDESIGLFSWRSVVAYGELYFIGRGGSADEQVFAHALNVLRDLLPDTLDEGDPVPFRNQLFRIRADEITGRAAVPRGGVVHDPYALPRSAPAGQPEADAKLRDLVIAALHSTLRDAGARVDITASDGVVALRGIVGDFATRRRVEEVVKSVEGVLVVVQQVEAEHPESRQRTAAELGRNAARALRTAALGIESSLKVVVENGWIRLEGRTSSEWDRKAAMDALHEVKGIRGLIDRTTSP